MIRTTFGLLALLALLPALLARDKPDTPTPAQQQYQALEKEFQKASAEFQKAINGAKTPQQQQKVFREKMPNTEKYAARFLKLAEKNSKDPVAVDALGWVVRNLGAGETRKKAVKTLLRDYIQSEKMANLCSSLGYARDQESRQLLNAVLVQSKHRPCQAQACLALAQQAENRMRLAQQFKDRPAMAKQYEAFLGKEEVEELVNAKQEDLSKEAEDLYERVVKDFANVADERGNKLSDRAKQKLDALQHPILVGKPAPEIEGEDIDAKKFKLSDYRGKVVLLDFWGHW